MRELIKITTNEQGSQVVSARDLHEFLGVQKHFTQWFEQQTEWFTENKDYTVFNLKVKNLKGGRPGIDYAITIDMAKELSMLSRTEKGKKAREYFIDCEKKLKEAAKPLSTLDMLELSIKQLREQESRVTAIEAKVLEIEAKTTTRPEYFTVMGYAVIKGTKVGLSLAAQLGRKAKQICQTKGYHIDKIYDPRFGRVGCYPASVLQEVFNTTMF